MQLFDAEPTLYFGATGATTDKGLSEPMTYSTEATFADPPSRRYCVITPCRDEAEFAQVTLDSMAAQTVLPTLWIIVDDGSTDQTPQILADFAEKHPWVKVLRRQDRGIRSVGAGVINAFYYGYDSIDPDDFDYVCKLDLDLDIPPTYFERMIEQMEADPRLGTVSGKPYMKLNGGLVTELCGDENSVGMAKFYRVKTFQQIGGFVRQVMWDGIDGHRCRMHGWVARSSDDPETRFIHLRPMGTSQKSWWSGRVRHGFGQYFMGTGFWYMFASCLFRLFHPPVVVGSFAMLYGWTTAAFRREKRYEDAEFRAFLTRYQHDCLLYGKARATAQFDYDSTQRWHPEPALHKNQA